MNIIEAATYLQRGRKVWLRDPAWPVHLDGEGFLAFDDGRTPPVIIDDLLSEKWTVVDE